MTQLAVAFDEDRKSFRPGETVGGRALWLLDDPPERIEVRLFWHTEGRGDTDVEVVETVGFDAPGPAGDQQFSFTLPDRPWSFSGRLVSLIWSLEIVALPSENSTRFDLTIGPDGREVVLPRTPV